MKAPEIKVAYVVSGRSGDRSWVVGAFEDHRRALLEQCQLQSLADEFHEVVQAHRQRIQGDPSTYFRAFMKHRDPEARYDGVAKTHYNLVAVDFFCRR